jgi:hypothetical protein
VTDVAETTLTGFLLARIAEDEAGIGEYDFDRPHWSGCDYFSPDHMGPECDCNYAARVLAECAAKRRIIEDVYPDVVLEFGPEGYMPSGRLLRALAAVYVDHPDYRQEWAL